jgi:hypothetical protein
MSEPPAGSRRRRDEGTGQEPAQPNADAPAEIEPPEQIERACDAPREVRDLVSASKKYPCLACRGSLW